MRVRQVLLAVALGGGGVYLLVERGLPLVRALAAGVIIAVLVQVLLATIGRTRYWYDRGTRGAKTWRCGNCNQRIYRIGGDWVLTCHRCGWRAGLPGLRWLTRSVPINQLRRSISLGQVLVVALALAVAVAGLPTGTLSNAIDSTGDPDADRLSNGTERTRQLGEYPLSESDPLRKDLYVKVLVDESVPQLTDREISQLESIWAGMPVENPDGSTGINIHIVQQPARRGIIMSGQQDFETLRDEVYSTHLSEEAACTVHVVALGEVTTRYDGYGSTPGYFAVADGTNTNSYGAAYTRRTVTITHELLHNIVGTFEDGSRHTAGGWLNGNTNSRFGENFYMSDRTARHLSEEGFDNSEYYQQTLC